MEQTRTIADWLAAEFPGAKKTTLRDMVERKRVRVNGVPAKSLKQEVRARDRVEVGDAERGEARLAFGLRVVYQDSDIVVVDKPSGLLTSTHSRETRPTVLEVLSGYYRNQGQKAPVLVVHRLDRDASGVLVLARGQRAFEKLKDLFETHDIERRYETLVHGKLKKPKGTLKHLLFEDEEGVVRVTGDRHKGKEAVLHYEELAAGPMYSRLRCTLETGRKHQIRVQMRVAGHPIAGDGVYGQAEPEGGPTRLALHAVRLGFAHPRTGKMMVFESPAPAGWSTLVKYEAKEAGQVRKGAAGKGGTKPTAPRRGHDAE